MGVVVQFMHPSGQSAGVSAGRKEWNTGAHCRSFLAMHGASTGDTAATKISSARLGVWAEWEAPALAIPTGSKIAPYAFEPEAPVFPSRPGLQNTDPFIFDGPFLYSNCRQVRRNGHPTKLRELSRGDVIIFGSHLSGTFVLDAVLVIAESELYEPATGERVLASRVSPSFLRATMRPLAGVRRRLVGGAQVSLDPCDSEHCDEEDDVEACGPPCTESQATHFRLYWGATPAAPVEGMFSFAPAKKLAESIVPFQRPALDLPFISAGLTQNWRACPAEAHDAWRAIATTVLGCGLELGVSFEIGARG